MQNQKNIQKEKKLIEVVKRMKSFKCKMKYDNIN